MKIAESQVIKNGEQELIDAITGDLDWNTIEQLLLKKHNFRLQEDVEYRSGDIVVHDNAIAYKLDFDVKVSLSVLFNRDGECLELSTSGEASEEDAEADEALATPGEPAEPLAVGPEEAPVPRAAEADAAPAAGDAGGAVESAAPEGAEAAPSLSAEEELGDLLAEGPEDFGLPAAEPSDEPLELGTELDEPEAMVIDDDFEELEPVLGLDLEEVDLDLPEAGTESADAPEAPPAAAAGEAPGASSRGDAEGEGEGKNREQITEMASQIADMISEINEK